MSRPKGKARVKANKKKRNQQKNSFFLRKKSLIGEIRKYDAPALSVECEVVVEGTNVKSLFREMRYVLNATENGVGLAASQIGAAKKMVIIKPDSDSNDITYMINPEIVSTSGKKKYGREGCLSYPNTFAFIERFTSIEVSYFDPDWKKHTIEYNEGDILGIVIQHELEHLELGHCQVYGWWKDPEGKKKELEETFKPDKIGAEAASEKVEATGGYDVVESDDLKKEKEEVDVELFPAQEELLKVIEAEALEEELEEK